ncbi:cache domain-containing sensor histidine kinase [Cohnella hongkongensis]|uniref:histidine kinase n=1 Tax=Cohnella hongkongensis TaxID=178337 RepID=A0ABV9FN32_9BACL
MKWFLRLSVRNKLLMVYTPLVLLPTFLVTIIGYVVFTGEAERSISSYVSQTASQTSRHLDTYMDELERISLLPYFHKEIMTLMGREGDGDDSEVVYQEYKVANQMFADVMLNPRTDLMAVFLYRNDERLYFTARYNAQLNPEYAFSESKLHRLALEANGQAVFVGNSNDGRVLNANNPVFSVARLVKSENGVPLGTIIIDANFNGVADLMANIGLGNKTNVLIFDSGNSLLYEKDQFELPDLDIDKYKSDGIRLLKLQKGFFLVATNTSVKTNWKTMIIVPFDELNHSIVTIRQLLFFVAVALMLLLLLLTYRFSGMITRQLRSIRELMKQVEIGNYNVSLDRLHQDEIGDLGRAFNKMSARINELVHQVLEVRYRQMKAELDNLKMQIRPHFLYNTLESIRALAEVKNNYELVDMAGALGALLRYNIKNHDSLVLLDQEFRYVRYYIRIQEISLSHSFQVSVQVDSRILQYYTLPFILQPIVENALQHGLYGMRSGGLLTLTGQLVGGHILIVVSDNGKGIPKNRLEQINALLEREKDNAFVEDGVGVGLLNVNKRIKMVHGAEYGIVLDSIPGAGTSVYIKLPTLRDGAANTLPSFHVNEEGE